MSRFDNRLNKAQIGWDFELIGLALSKEFLKIYLVSKDFVNRKGMLKPWSQI